MKHSLEDRRALRDVQVIALQVLWEPHVSCGRSVGKSNEACQYFAIVNRRAQKLYFETAARAFAAISLQVDGCVSFQNIDLFHLSR